VREGRFAKPSYVIDVSVLTPALTRTSFRPVDDLSLIIGIVHPANPREIELVDGSHRLASMILNNVEHVEGYLGYYSEAGSAR
jgi:hypothetical protein